MTDILIETAIALEQLAKNLRNAATPDTPVQLSVPYISQWGPGANERRSDCGPAALAMVVHYLTPHRPTVDQVAYKCLQPIAASSTSIYQLRGGPSSSVGEYGSVAYGLTANIRAPYIKNPLTLDVLKSQIDKQKPSIVLIDYKKLRILIDLLDNWTGPKVIQNQDYAYNGGHWVTFVGYNQTGVFIHDPDFWGVDPRGEYRYIPNSIFVAALESPAAGNAYGSQGLIY